MTLEIVEKKLLHVLIPLNRVVLLNHQDFVNECAMRHMCLNPLESGRVVKWLYGFTKWYVLYEVLIPLNRVVLLNVKQEYIKEQLDFCLNPLESGRVVKLTEDFKKELDKVLIPLNRVVLLNQR